MNYTSFILSSILSLCLAIGLFLLLWRRLQINWCEQNEHGATYILPAVITILFVALCLLELRPRILDGIEIFNKKSYNYTVDAAQVSFDRRRLVVDDEHYFFISEVPQMKERGQYLIHYLPHTRILIGMDELPDPQAETPK